VNSETTRTSGKASIADVRRQLELIDPRLVGHENGIVYRHAIVLLSSLVVGNDISNLARFTGYPRTFIAQIYYRMQEAELWVGDLIRFEHWNYRGEMIFDVNFWIDVMVAHGGWIRFLDEKGNYDYEQIGLEAWEEDLLLIQ